MIVSATRRWIARSLAFGLAMTGVRAAQADDRGDVLDSRHKSYETAQNFEIELRFSPYVPDIDSDPALHGAKPYASTFNSPKNHLLFGLELDYQAFRIPHFGSIGPGFGISSTSMTAPAREKADPTMLSAENTSLQIFPMYLAAVLRIDVLSRDLKIPIVPYAKGGIGYALWRAYNDGGTSYAPASASTPNELISGRGHTWGTQFAFGVGFDLGSFDGYASGNLDQATGINHTYLYGEYYLSTLNGLGQKDALYVGDNSFAAGIAFEF